MDDCLICTSRQKCGECRRLYVYNAKKKVCERNIAVFVVYGGFFMLMLCCCVGFCCCSCPESKKRDDAHDAYTSFQVDQGEVEDN